MNVPVFYVGLQPGARDNALSDVALFSYRESSTIDIERILRDPNWSLYCFDFVEQTAVYVECPSEVNLATAAFVYVSQREQARRAAMIPFAALERIAATPPFCESPLPIHIQSVGRCGSTLLSRLFTAIGVPSLSEPDALSQVQRLRKLPQLSDSQLMPFIRAAALMQWPAMTMAGRRYAVKLRGESCSIADLIASTVPTLPSIFLYRSAVGVVNSWLRLVGGEPHQVQRMENLAAVERVFPGLGKYPFNERIALGRAGPIFLAWLAKMEIYLGMASEHRFAAAVRYEDLEQDPAGVIRALLQAVKLTPSVDEKAIQAVVKQDVQAGTRFSMDRVAQAAPLTEAEREIFTTFLKRHGSEIEVGNWRAPRTLGPTHDG